MKPDIEMIEAFRVAEQEMQDEWKARQAAVANGHHPGSQWCDPNLLLAAHWLIVFAPARVKIVIDGLSIGNALDILKKERGCMFPPVVEQVWQEWNEKIEAARIERQPEWKKRSKLRH